MTPDLVPAYLYEQLRDELLIDPDRIYVEFDAELKALNTTTPEPPPPSPGKDPAS
jgi:hypothetical protein